MLNVILFPFALVIIIGKQLIKRPILIVLVFFAVAGVMQLQNCSRDQVRIEIPTYQLNAPKSYQAGTVFATPSRIYYAVKYTDLGDGNFILDEYYTYRGDKWILADRPLDLKLEYYGGIKVYENTN